MHHLHVYGESLIRKGPAEARGNDLLLAGPSGSGNPCADRKVFDGLTRTHCLLDKGPQNAGRFFEPAPLRIGGRAPPLNAARAVVTLCEKGGLGATSVEANGDVLCSHEASVRVEG
jgi:hypothetical protein